MGVSEKVCICVKYMLLEIGMSKDFAKGRKYSMVDIHRK